VKFVGICSLESDTVDMPATMEGGKRIILNRRVEELMRTHLVQ